MRGLAFIGGEAPRKEDWPAISSSLGVVDHIVAADSGLSVSESYGIRPDLIVGDMDSIEEPARLGSYRQDQIRRYPRDKDYTDTELALDALWDEGCGYVCLVGGGGGRLDHTLALAALFERRRSPDRWITRNEDIRRIDTFQEIPVQVGATASVFPLGTGPWRIRSAGLEWALDSLPWERGFFGISNRTKADLVSLEPTAGRFLFVLLR